MEGQLWKNNYSLLTVFWRTDLECGGKRYPARRRFGAGGPESGAAARAQRGSCHSTPSCVSHQTGAAAKANGYGHLRENRVRNRRLQI
jgi:hypothetical protein